MLKSPARRTRIGRQTAQNLSKDRPLIMLVDDDAEFQALVRGWLTRDYDTVSFSSGEELLEELPDLEPSLIIMDIKMPGPDGFKLCEKIHAQTRLSRVPVLFLTGCKSDEDFLKNLEAGGAAYVTKPVDRCDLLAEIREILED